MSARNQGFVSNSILLISSISDAVPPFFCASLKPCVIDANIWNLKNDIGWNVN